MKDIVQILRSLGFADSETKTYLAALRHGPGTAIDLANETGLSRQTIYLAIDDLIERGLMASVERGVKTLFSAELPMKLLAYAKRHQSEIQERLDDLASIVPELELQSGGEKPVIRMFEGKEGVLAVLQELRGADAHEVFEIADLETLYRCFTPEIFRPLQECVGESLRVHGIYRVPDTQELKNADADRLPAEFDGFHGNISVFGDTIVLASFEGKMHSMIIESRAIANTLRILLTLGKRSLTDGPKT